MFNDYIYDPINFLGLLIGFVGGLMCVRVPRVDTSMPLLHSAGVVVWEPARLNHGTRPSHRDPVGTHLLPCVCVPPPPCPTGRYGHWSYQESQNQKQAPLVPDTAGKAVIMAGGEKRDSSV